MQLTKLDTTYRRLPLSTWCGPHPKSLDVLVSLCLSLCISTTRDTFQLMCLKVMTHMIGQCSNMNGTLYSPLCWDFFVIQQQRWFIHISCGYCRTIPIVPPSTHLVLQYVAWRQEETLSGAVRTQLTQAAIMSQSTIVVRSLDHEDKTSKTISQIIHRTEATLRRSPDQGQAHKICPSEPCQKCPNVKRMAAGAVWARWAKWSTWCW